LPRWFVILAARKCNDAPKFAGDIAA